MSKRIYAITGDNQLVESYISISYCGMIFDMSPYKIKCLIENETKIEHPANFGEVTLKFENYNETKSETICDTESETFKNITGDETICDTESLTLDCIGGYKKGFTDGNNNKTSDNTQDETLDITESLTKDEIVGYKKGFTDGYACKTSDNTESLTKEIKQLNSKIESLQDIIDGYNEIYANLVDEQDSKVFKLESENSRLKNQCNLMTMYLNKIRRKVGFYVYEDYIMNENDGIRLKEKLENIIERVTPKSDEK